MSLQIIRPRVTARFFGGLAAVCILMGVLQWLVGPARGGRDAGLELMHQGHTAIGSSLLTLANSRSLRAADVMWQMKINFPRNWLLTQIGWFSLDDEADLYSWSDQMHPWHDAINSTLLAVSSLMIYSIVFLAAAAMISKICQWPVSPRRSDDEAAKNRPCN